MRKLKYLLLISVFSLSSMFFVTSCEDNSVDIPDFTIFSPQSDVELGAELAAEIEANPQQYPILNDAQAESYVQNMADEILKSDEIKYGDVFVYDVKIIHDDNTVNAFCAPGGYIYVYTGLIKFLDNEASLAGVMAHEISHAERRHASKRITKQYGVSVVLGMLLGENPSMVEEITANLLTGYYFLENSRDDEYEADEYSFKYLMDTKWYPAGIIGFFDKVDDNREASYIEKLLSTHPQPEDRRTKIEDMVVQFGLTNNPGEDMLFTQEYNAFKASLP
jgi:predicted Zn-dependent protease